MKRNDTLTLIGFLVGIGMMAFGIISGGLSEVHLFWDAPSVAITVLGSLSAVMIVTPMDQFKKIGKLLGEAFKESAEQPLELVTKFGEISQKARKEGLLSLEETINALEDQFMKKGLQMVVDGIEPDSIKAIMELEIGSMEDRHAAGANIFKTWGAMAPGFGMLGTLIGLVQMLGNLSDASTIASGMGKALLTTFYGSLLANLFASPVAQNLQLKSGLEATRREMMLEGILAIQAGLNPKMVEEKLLAYLSPAEREAFANASGEGGEA